MAPFSGKSSCSPVNNLADLLIVSILKEKASQVKSASVKSYGTARERLANQTATSTTTGRTKPPPPPPPAPRRSSSSSYRRNSSVAQVSATPSGTTDVETINWANLSAEDKQAFFAWLDEFFACYLDGPPPSNASTVSIPTKSPGNNTPAPSPRPSPSLPHRRISSRSSQNTGSDPQGEVAPAAGRRNLPPSLSHRGPVRTLFLRRLSETTEMLGSQRSNIPQNHLRLQKCQSPVHPLDFQIPQILVRFLFTFQPSVHLSHTQSHDQPIFRCRSPHPRSTVPPRPTSQCSCTRPHPGTPNGTPPARQSHPT